MKLKQFGDFTESATAQAIEELHLRFSEDNSGSFDFARCQRADGSFYGTSGSCRLGKEAGAKEAPERKPRMTRGAKVKELEAKIKDLQSRSESELNKGFRDRALQLSKEANKLMQEKADLQKSAPERKPRAAKKMADMTTEERRAALEKRVRAEVSSLRKDPNLREIWQKEYNGGSFPRRFPSELAMAKDVATKRIQKDRDLVEKRARQEKGPQGEANIKMAREILTRGADKGDARQVQAGSELLREANRSMNKEIRVGQRRGRQLQDAEARLFRIEMDLRNKTNKMDRGFEKDDPKVRARLARVQAAQEKVKKLRDQNLKFRQQAEGPLRERLKDAGSRLEALASEIRRQEGPARKQQLDNVRSLMMEVTRTRKRLNDGPGFSPDLGGKGGEPINVSKLYDSLNID